MKKTFLFFTAVLILSSCFKKEDLRIDIPYSGEQLRYINCPLGGIGTGNILVNGYGSISELEIFNRASMDELPPYMTFFSLYAQQGENDPVLRIMEGEYLNEFPNPFGKPRQQLGGLPRFRDAVFHNAYPVISVDLADEEVPLLASMTAWSPFIPVDPENSGLPCAVIEWTLENPGKEEVAYSVAFTMGNPFRSVGRDSKQGSRGCSVTPNFGSDWNGMTFSSPESELTLPDAGGLSVSFPSEGQLCVTLHNTGWWDDAQMFWEDFSSDGKLMTRSDTLINDSDRENSGAMYLSGTLAPGESVTMPFIFTWHIPYRKLEPGQAFGNRAVEQAIVKNYYANRFANVGEVTSYVLSILDQLRNKTMQFSNALITSTVPAPVLDATISNMASLKTNLIMRDEKGNVHGFEGLGNDFGCCPGNCTHVWNYAQTMAAIFPSLERNVREISFGNATHSNGYQCFRTVFPLSENWFKNVAADGQMGNIIRVYREWKMSGSNEWLGNIWPQVKLALDFAWKGTGEPEKGFEWMKNCPVPWDPDKEGVLRGEQHNTYDINFFGPNMMTGSLYLGALKACSEMALAMNEPQNSVEYNEIYERGLQKYRELLWNGEYFKQDVEVIEGIEIPERLKSPPDASGKVIPKYQYGNGCLSDQLLGQYLAFVSGMGYILDTAETKSALAAIFKYNFRQQMRDFENVQRIYAANDEPGLVLCSWPMGEKPLLPFVYADEVWTGVEYQVAASMLYADLVEEGLAVTTAVRKRYDGSNRNPFAEIESGRYYARAMASWSVYQAMSGYNYDGTKGTMEFAPAIAVLPLRYFWSTANGWGTIVANRSRIELKCLFGSLEIESLSFSGNKFFVLKDFIPSQQVESSFVKGNSNSEGTLLIRFPQKLVLSEGQSFLMELP